LAVAELAKCEKAWDAIGDHQKEGDVDVHEDAFCIWGLWGLYYGLSVFLVVRHILLEFNLNLAIKQQLILVLLYSICRLCFQALMGVQDHPWCCGLIILIQNVVLQYLIVIIDQLFILNLMLFNGDLMAQVRLICPP
jgi:hypothetical protein